jgi:TPR repeat protein
VGLGRCYRFGEGITKDSLEAVKWLRRAAEKEHAGAQVELGEMYDLGEGVPKDSGEAMKWYHKAAEKGYDIAQFLLGEMYARGEGVTKDPSEAVKWYRKAAEQDHPYAQFALGLAYDSGEGVPVDFSEAMQFYLKAAEKDIPEAQFNLGVMYSNGEGVLKSSLAAIEWYSRAADTYIAEGRRDDALTALERMRALEPNHPFVVQLTRRLFADESSIKRKTPSTEASPQPVSFGSGWIAHGGYVVTCFHVVEKAQRIWVVHANGKKVLAKIVLRDQMNDLAILAPQYPGVVPPGIPLASTKAQMGAKVFTIGYPQPDLMGVKPKFTSGEVSSTTGVDDDPRIYQISVPVQMGNSGGPLVNLNGEVVGVVTAKLNALATAQMTGDIPQNVNYALKSSYVSLLLGNLEARAQGRMLPNTPAGPEDLAKRIEDSVVMVVCE